MSSQARFYTVSNAPFFPGTVALLNSLRLTGNDQELVVLDVGLTETQRESLANHSTIVELPNDSGRRPEIFKPYPALIDADGVTVLIDSDMIVTASLAPIIALAEAGKICAWPEPPWSRQRWFAEWEDLFDLAGPPRHQGYVNAGFVALSTEHWPDFLDRWWRACTLVPMDRLFGGNAVQEPLYAGDQDALNAILMSELPPDAVERLSSHATHKPKVVVEDKRTLACTYQGDPEQILHEGLRPKVWLPEGWRRVRANAYTLLMPRVLFEDDVALRLDPAEVPLWLRPGVGAKLARRGLHATTRARDVAARGRRAPRRIMRETRRAVGLVRATLPSPSSG